MQLMLFAQQQLWYDRAYKRPLTYLLIMLAVRMFLDNILTSCSIHILKTLAGGHPRSGTTLLRAILDSHPLVRLLALAGALAAMMHHHRFSENFLTFSLIPGHIFPPRPQGHYMTNAMQLSPTQDNARK